MAPQGAALPRVTYSQVGDIPVHASGSDPNINQARFQVSCWGSSYSDADSVAKQVKAALRDYSGTIDTITIQRIFYDGRADMREVDPETQEITYHVALDFIIWWEA